MSEITISWETKAKRKLTPWRDSANKSKSAKRYKRKTVESYQDTHSHREISKPSSYTTESWRERAHEIQKRGAALGEEDPLDAEYEALYISVHYDYSDKYWKSLAKALLETTDCVFTLDVLMSLYEVYAASQKNIEDTGSAIHEKAVHMLPVLRRQIAVAKKDEYATVLAQAERYWDSREHLADRLQLAYLFPEKPEWGDEVCELWPSAHTEEANKINQYYKIASLFYATGASPESLQQITDKLFAPDPNSTSSYYYYRSITSPEWNTLFDALDYHGEAILPVLIDLYGREWNSHPTPLAETLALVKSPEVATAFADKLWQWSNYYRRGKDFVVDMTYLHDNPDISLPALEAVLPKATRNKDRIEEVIADLSAQLVNAEREEEHSELYVNRDTLPRGLANPPWRDKSVKLKKRKKFTPEKFADLEMIDFEVTYDLTEEGGGEEHDKRAATERGEQTEDEVITEIFAEVERSYYWYWYITQHVCKLSREGLAKVLEKLPPEKLARVSPSNFQRVFVRPLGTRAIPALEKYLAHAQNSANIIDVMASVSSPAVIPHIGWGMTRVSVRRKATAWVKKHPEACAVGAIPALLKATDAKKRNGFIEALCMAWAADQEAVQRVIDAYGEDVAAALPALDVHLQCPNRMPKLPHFWTPDLYPKLRLKSDPSKLLPQEIYEDIGFMLKFSAPGAPYIGLVELGEIADETSLAEFSWGIFESWVKADAPNKESWVIQAIAMFGGAQMADALPYYIDRWYDSSYNKRAEKLMYALVNDENPYIIEVFWRLLVGGFNWALHRATAHIKSITGVDAKIDVIADATAPTFGMNAARKIELVEGADLEVWLDSDLEPHLRRTDKSVAELDPTTQLRWERLQALCSRQNKFQALRFERAMKIQRRWAQENWHDTIFSHPLLGLIAQRIVWGSYDDAGNVLQTFRIDESNALVDVEDEPCELVRDTKVGIVHPAELDDDAIKAWSEVLIDYEIIQPFEQITRPVYRANGADIEELFNSLSGKKTTLGAIQHLCYSNNWHDKYNRKRDASISHLRKELESRAGTSLFTVTFDFWPGFRSGMIPNMNDEVSLQIAKASKKHPSWGQVDQVELAELYYELDWLVSTTFTPET